MSETPPSTPVIEILTIGGCPNAAVAHDLVVRSLAAAGIDASVVLHEIATADEAAAVRFLGSPTIRVNGVDVEPDAAERVDFVLSCRIFRTANGYAGVPDEAWVTSALAASRRG